MNERLSDNSDILKQLVETVSLLSDLMSRFIRTHDDSLQQTSGFREDLRELRSKIEKIAKVLHEGNGQQPIITRLALVEQKMVQFEKNFENQEKQKSEDKTAYISLKSGVIVAIIAGIATLAAAVIGVMS